MIIKSFPRSELPVGIATAFSELVSNIIRNRGECRVVLTGGGLGIETLRSLLDQSVPWEKIKVIFSDERFVDFSDSDRNELQALSANRNIEQSRFLRYPNQQQTLEAAAEEFSSTLEGEFGPLGKKESTFDIVLLGMGPDGHVASLFPGRSHKSQWVVAEPNSPKPPLERLSLSYQALNNAERVWFLVAGSEKADAVRNAMKAIDLPAGRVRGLNETIWWMDQELSDAL